MLAVTLEDRVFTYVDHYVEVTSRTALSARLAFTRQTNTVTCIDTRRHLDRKRLLLFDPTLPMAATARIGNHFAAAMTARAGLLNREEALLHAHLADATTGGTGNRTGALLGTGTVASLAFSQGRHPDGDRGAPHGLFQIQLKGVAQIAAALSTATRAAATASKEIAEHIAKDVGEIGVAVSRTRASSHLGIDAGMTVLVVGLTLARIRKHFVSLVGFLECVFSGFVSGITVRMMLHCEATISLFQLCLAGAALDTQHFVIVTFGHKFPEPSNSYPPDTPTREQAPARRSTQSRHHRIGLERKAAA